jgi:hypothetical protein
VRERHLKWQQNFKLAALSHHAADFNAPVTIFHNTVGEREAKTGAIAFGGVEGPEDVSQILRRDARPVSPTATLA